MVGASHLHDTYGIESPAHVEFGFGATAELGEYAERDGIRSVLIVTDANLLENGVVSKPRWTLEDAGVAVDVFDGVAPEPKIAMAEAAAERLRANDYDAVVGVGGGSSMDTAKFASAIASCDTPPREMLGMDNVPGEVLPIALIPTTAGTGSEVTHIGVFTDAEDGNTKKVVYSSYLFADLAIVDPALTASLPGPVAAATGMDALTHAIEAYVTTLHNPYTDILASRSMQLLGENLRRAVHNGANDDEARYEMSLAATLGGQAFVNSGLGAVHALTYPLGIEYGLGHGLANAVLLPYVVAYNLPATPGRYADVARFLGYEPTPGDTEMDVARGAVSAIHDLNADVEIPADISGFGEMDEDDFERFADVAFEYSEHNIDRNPRTLDRDDVTAIFRNAYHGR